MLVPDAQVGVFAAYNSKGNGAGATLGPLFGAFMDRYFPGTPAANAAPSGAGAGSSARSIAGSYMPSRRGESNMAYLAALLQQTRVSTHDDGSISLTGTALRWHETAPGFWQAGGLRRHLIFKQDATGRWQFSDGNPVNIHQRAAWYQHSALMISLLLVSIAGCSVSVAVWAVRAVRGNPGPGAAPAAATANLLVWGAAAVLLALAATRPELVSRAWFDRALSTLQVAGWGIAAGLVAIMWRTRRAWLEPGESGYSLALRGLAFLACLASLLFAWQANLLAFGLRY